LEYAVCPDGLIGNLVMPVINGIELLLSRISVNFPSPDCSRFGTNGCIGLIRAFNSAKLPPRLLEAADPGAQLLNDLPSYFEP
jgi:hypothetical protein